MTSSPSPTKTPFYRAINAARYQRQALIRKIESDTGRTLICYVAGTMAPIERDDTVPLIDLLHNVVPDSGNLDLLLHTGGGDIDAAEKLVLLLQRHVGAHELRVVVPDHAKSAGTLMVLGADAVVMSDSSELGPIDPQVVIENKWHSVLDYLDAYEAQSAIVRAAPDDPVANLMLSKFDPWTLRNYSNVRDRARQLAETHLKMGMFNKRGGNFTATVRELLDNKRWQSHGQMISWQDASDPRLGLTVEYLAPQSPTWQDYWQLYCLQRLATMQPSQKLFESALASLVIET